MQATSNSTIDVTIPESIAQLLEALEEQVALIDRSGVILSANGGWHAGHDSPNADTSWPLAKPVGTNYLDCWRDCRHRAVPGASAACAALEAVLTGRQLRSDIELEWPAPGRRCCLRMTVSAASDDSTHVAVIQTDLSLLREAETQLRIAAVAFETPEGRMVVDAGGTIVQVNSAFCAITGYQEADVIGKSPSVLSSGRHSPAFYETMWSTLRERGNWDGEVWNRRKNGDVYPERLSIACVRDRAGSITHYVASLSDITVSIAASEEIRSLAFYDPLTRLPNRRLLLDRLAQAQANSITSGRAAALMFLDLDNFKTLNDSLGHSTGDLLLQQVALRLQMCLRHSDLVARIGGDEFVLLIEGLDAATGAANAQSDQVVANVMAAFDGPFMLGSHHCRSTPSIGVTIFRGIDSPGAEILLQQADIAMYQAKQAGRNGHRFFTPGMQDAINVRAQREDALREAVALQQFELHYQVQVDHHGKARGAEALLRWRRADGSWVAPGDFIGLAEETGLILPIGEWVLEQACAQLREWSDVPWLRDLELAVNVSARQFHQSGFCEQVAAAMQRHQINPARLKLELTEGILLDNLEETVSRLHTLKRLGVAISLDDFGTGYSSLQYLKRLPLDQLKIDQSFVRDLVADGSDQAIVLTIIMIATSLGLDLIAEGVETEAQRNLLEELGCRQFQGYLFSRAVDAETFARLLGPAAPGWPASTSMCVRMPHPLIEENIHA